MKTKTLSDLISTWFGCGWWPWGPGTAGSLGGLIVAVAWLSWSGAAAWSMLVWAVLLTPIGMWAADTSARLAGKDDPQFVVVDEVLGQWIALGGATIWNWKSTLAAFVLFRLFDIWKPYPVRQLEQLHGGIGIVADDLMAGVYGAVVLFILGCFNLY